MAELAAGTELGGRFRVLGVLGSGGMATVYLCDDRVRGERVALKVLHAHLADDAAMRGRLRREVVAAGRIRHPAALVAHELHELDGRLLLSMPYHPGQTLAERVATGGPLPVEAVRALGLRLLEVLADAHRAGVLHRDLSPSNVMIDERGEAMLTDFGLARLDDAPATRSTGVLGTAGYTAPEIYEGNRAEPRSDLYGLGAVLYLAATGHAPFGGGAPAGVLQRQLEGKFRPLGELRPELPPELSSTITSLLRTEVEERPEGAEAVIEALVARRAPDAQRTPERSVAKEVTAGLPRSPPPGEWAVDVWERARDRRRRAGLRHLAGGFQSEPGAFGELVRQRVESGVRAWLQVGQAVSPEATLVAAVATETGVPPASLTVPRSMLDRHFRLVEGVDARVAQRLSAVAESAGFRAAVVPVANRRPDWMVKLPPQLVPMVWVALGLLVATGIGVLLAPFALVVAIAITVFVNMARQDANRTLAFPAPAAAGQPSARPLSPPLTRAASLAKRAATELDRLAELVAGPKLSALAAEELGRTVKEARQELVALVAEADGVEAEIARLPPEQDHAWADTRLTRLRTRERAGETVDADELARLVAAVSAREAAILAGAGLEAKLVSRLARIMEIGASASRARRELVGADSPRTADTVALRLQAQARAAAAARKEVG